MLDLARRGARALLARDWLDLFARHPADSAADPQTARQAHDLYRDFLTACREREQLSFLQPGRFLNRGQAADASVLLFCPVPLPVGARPRPGSLALDIILAVFRIGRRNLLRLLFGARIDRVLFAATKADHVPALQRDHLEALMANLVAVPTLRAQAA